MKVNHPTLPGVNKCVPEDLVEKFLSNGWTEAPAEVPADTEVETDETEAPAEVPKPRTRTRVKK